MEFVLDQDVLRAAARAGRPGLLDGHAVAQAVRAQVRRAVELLRREGLQPRLDVVLVGDDPASEIYVRHKVRACADTGITSRKHKLPADVDEPHLHELLDELNTDPSVYGVLLQLPIPEHLDSIDAIDKIRADRDVDGFHVCNLGKVMAWRGALEPCTPRGIITMLRAYDVEPRGMRAVVVGRSIGVGRPMGQMLVRADATTTICHRYTADLRDEVERADLLVVATGVAHLVKGEWIKPGAIVVDVGINRGAEGWLVGDVEFDVARERASLITPVPGGVGPMTVATLMENTVRATCARHGLRISPEGLTRLEQ